MALTMNDYPEDAQRQIVRFWRKTFLTALREATPAGQHADPPWSAYSHAFLVAIRDVRETYGVTLHADEIQAA